MGLHIPSIVTVGKGNACSDGAGARTAIINLLCMNRCSGTALPFSHNHDGRSEVGMPQVLDNVSEHAGDRLCIPSGSDDHQRGGLTGYLFGMTAPR